jgi:leucyl aminopeptidase (aminopeptidase T)
VKRASRRFDEMPARREMVRDIDFIDWKAVVNNLRTKVNMLSSKLAVHLLKTLMPKASVRGVFMF